MSISRKTTQKAMMYGMTFRIYKRDRNIYTVVRDIGYKPIAVTDRGEFNCVRPLGADYPRFHIYLKEEKDIITFNIHLDQKRPVYKGTTAHSGDYAGEVVENEVARIKAILYQE